MVTLMLVADVGDKMCEWQLKDVGDGFGDFGHQHPLSFPISVEHQRPKMSPTSKNCYQFHVINIMMSPTSLSPFISLSF